MSLKNQDHEIVHVVVGTSFAEQPHGDGRAKKIAFWINVGGVPTAFESIDAVAAELGVRPLEMRGTLASSLTKSSFAGSANDIPGPGSAAVAVVQYQKLPRASLMMKLAEDEADYGEIKPTTPAALADLYASRALPRVSSSSDDATEMPPLPVPVAADAEKRGSTNISVLLPDAEQPVKVRVSRGSTAASLVAPALAKRLPLSTLAATAYSFVGMPTPLQPGFIVNANVPLEALLELIGGGADNDDDDEERRAVLEMWELPDVLNVRLASSGGDARATVLDFGVPLDRMLRVLRLRFGDKLGAGDDVLLQFNDKWLRLAVSLEAQGIARATSYGGVLTIHTLADARSAIGAWRCTQTATFEAVSVRLFDEQRVLAAGDALFALEFLVVVLHGDTEIVLSRRGASRDVVLRLRAADAAQASTWFELLRRASLQSARRVFNVPLDELLRRDGRRAVVPQLVHAAVSFLRGLEPLPPALFQRSGSPQLLALLRAQADGGMPLVFDALDAADAHAVASLLLEFLAELPEPPVTYALVTPLCLNFADALGKLPAENADLLRFVCDFFNELCARQRLSAERLATFVCHALVRRPVSSVSSSVYYRAASESVLGDLAVPEVVQVDQQQLALVTNLIQFSSRIPGPRGVARSVAKKVRSRGRARSDALSYVK